MENHIFSNSNFDPLRRYNYLFDEISYLYHEAAVKMGLSESEMNILYTICNFGESCPLNKICKLSGMNKQTINSAIRKMEQADIVYLEAIDGKSKKVCLTEVGKELVSKTVLRLMKIENDIYASWPEEDLETYLKLMERFSDSFKEKIKEL